MKAGVCMYKKWNSQRTSLEEELNCSAPCNTDGSGHILIQTELLAKGPGHSLVLWCTQAELVEGFPPQELPLSLGNWMMPSGMSAQRDDKMVFLSNLSTWLWADRETLVKM